MRLQLQKLQKTHSKAQRLKEQKADSYEEKNEILYN